MKRLAFALLLAGCQVSLPLEDNAYDVRVEPPVEGASLQVPSQLDVGSFAFFSGYPDENDRLFAIPVRNLGTTPVQLLGASVEAIAGEASELCLGSGCTVDGLEVAPGALLRLVSSVRAATEGLKQFRVEVRTTAGTFIVGVRGTATARGCQFQLTPASVGFPPPERRALIQFQNLSTSTDGACLVTDVSLTAGFALAEGFQLPLRVEPNSSLVMMARTTLEEPVGTLTVRLHDGTTGVVALERDWVPPPGDCLTIAPQAYDFGEVEVGCGSAQRFISLSNTCSQPLVVDVAPGSLSSFELVGGHTQARLLPGAAPLSLSVRFQPSSPGVVADAIPVSARYDQGPAGVAYLAVNGRGVAGSRNTDTYLDSPSRRFDMLLVVDDSPSMAARLPRIEAELTSYFRLSTAFCWDAQIGVVRSSQLTGALEPAIVQGYHNANAGSQLVAAIGAIDFTAAEPQPVLGTAVAALTNASNSTLFRSGVTRDVVLLTDAEDASSVSVGALRSALPAGSSLKLISPTATPPAACLAEPVASDGRLEQALALFPEPYGQRNDLCAPGWFSIGSVGFCRRDNRYSLTSAPREDTLAVTINGVAAAPSQWSYDAATNTLVLTEDGAPGRTLDVSYDVACRTP